MAQAYSGQMPNKAPDKVRVGIDLGAYAVKVYVSEIRDAAHSTADWVNYPLHFRTARTNTTEFGTTLAFSEDRLHFAYLGGLRYPGSRVFGDYKLGAMGLEPYARILAEDCDLLRQSAPHMASFTPANLFREVFAHIYEKVQAHIYEKYDSEFDEIECVLTYPVSHSESLQILLLQEASAARFKVVESVSESMAFVFARHAEKPFTPRDGAVLFFDMGAATMDVAAAYVDDEGKLVQACPSDGLPCGGSKVNQLAREWLRHEYPHWEALNDERAWARYISPQIDDCKISFTGESDLSIDDGRADVIIASGAMKSFFEPLLADALKLIKRSLAKARAAKHDIRQIFVCGGGFGNQPFFEEFYRRLLDETEITACERILENSVVAKGALCYARSPLVEECVTTRHLGFTYDGDYHPKTGKRLKSRTMRKGIGWVMPAGTTPETPSETWTNLQGLTPGSFYLEFEKIIQCGSTLEGDQVIETELWASPANSQTFHEEHIMRNNLITWPCDITYPVPKGMFSQLSHLGTFSGKIPHDELFPPGTGRKNSNFKFRLALQPDPNSHLLSGLFGVWLSDGRLCELREVRYIPLPLVPRSHYENQICLEAYQTLDSDVEAPSTSEQRSTAPAEESRSPSLPRTDVVRTRARSQPTSVTLHSLLQPGDAATIWTTLETLSGKPLPPLHCPSDKVLQEARDRKMAAVRDRMMAEARNWGVAETHELMKAKRRMDEFQKRQHRVEVKRLNTNPRRGFARSSIA